MEDFIEVMPNETKRKPKNALIISLIVLAMAIIFVVGFIMFYKYSNRKLSAEEIYGLIGPSTVEINATGDTFGSTGTGSFIDGEGTVVTNYHVIESCYAIKIKVQDGTVYEVESVLGFDKDRDLAIIKTSCKNNSFVELKTDKTKTGEKVYTLGSSLGLTGTFSEGIISSASRKIDGFEFIQTTAPISSGNSGGPLVDEYGKVIGITTGAFIEGQNLNLAIPASEINKISRGKTYSINDFFQISEGKEIEQDNESVNDKPVEEEDYIPIDVGCFDSLKGLEEAAQRNPDLFELPVVVSVKGLIARTDENQIFLIEVSGDDFDSKYSSWLVQNEHKGELIKSSVISETEKLSVYMLDDTKNRVLTGDNVILNGIYRHSIKTLSDCTYEFEE